MKKFIYLIIAFLTAYVAREVTDHRIVKFEKYKTTEELQGFLYSKYQIGSDGEKLYTDLKSSGAKCEDLSNVQTRAFDLLKYKYVVACNYNDSFFHGHLH